MVISPLEADHNSFLWLDGDLNNWSEVNQTQSASRNLTDIPVSESDNKPRPLEKAINSYLLDGAIIIQSWWAVIVFLCLHHKQKESKCAFWIFLGFVNGAATVSAAENWQSKVLSLSHSWAVGSVGVSGGSSAVSHVTADMETCTWALKVDPVRAGTSWRQQGCWYRVRQTRFQEIRQIPTKCPAVILFKHPHSSPQTWLCPMAVWCVQVPQLQLAERSFTVDMFTPMQIPSNETAQGQRYERCQQEVGNSVEVERREAQHGDGKREREVGDQWQEFTATENRQLWTSCSYENSETRWSL